ncbi:MAG: sigma-54 dependent transcriptional regulator [Gemmataceae bacterium]
MPALTALLISRDESLVSSVQEVLDSIPQLDLRVESSLADALPAVHDGQFSLVLWHATCKKDYDEALQWLELPSGLRHPPATIVLADDHHPEEALRILRQGAADYLSRPLDLGRLSYLVDTLTVRMRFTKKAESRSLELIRREGQEEPFFYLDSAAMGDLMQQVHRVAPQETFLLLGGETGTGKTRLARLIHELSPRRHHPFLVVNCGALADSLIESELFGHVRGAFTGADRDRIGKFAAAGQGTLLLDEIDALPLPLQAKFLRAVEERVFEPVGSNKLLPLRARLISASNKSLEKEVEAGRFRSDLYYRLNVVSFYLPPLRERTAIIAHLAEHFIAAFAARNRRPVRGITEEALEALELFDWPGNIRELRNAIERAVALCPGHKIGLADLPQAIRGAVSVPTAFHRTDPAAPIDRSKLRHAKGEAEAAWIARALGKHRNNRLRTAAELGISRMTLYKKMHLYGLMAP